MAVYTKARGMELSHTIILLEKSIQVICLFYIYQNITFSCLASMLILYNLCILRKALVHESFSELSIDLPDDDKMIDIWSEISMYFV